MKQIALCFLAGAAFPHTAFSFVNPKLQTPSNEGRRIGALDTRDHTLTISASVQKVGNDVKDSDIGADLEDRRNSIQKMIKTMAIPAIAGSRTFSSAAGAIDVSLLDAQAKRFAKVPVFAIVNGETGIPFMILRNTGAATGYFFTSIEGAQLVLDDARKDAQEKDLETRQFWANARINAVSMEFALKLAKGRPKASAQNGVKYDTVYDIIPTVKALDDGGKIDKSGLYTEQGRVPLFYMDEFEIGPAAEGGENRIPVFFEKKDLLEQWAKKYPDQNTNPPPVKVMDLIDTFSTLVGSSTILSSVDSRVAKALFPVASVERRRQAVECEKARGTVPAYKLGEMIAVGGK